MKQSNWDEYRSLMNDVELPDRVHARVMREVRKEHAAETGPKPRPRPRARRTQPSFAFKAAVAAFCAVALTTGVAFASGMVELPEQLFPFSQLSDKPNSFTLEAYAAGNPGGTKGASVVLRNGLNWGGSSGAFYDPETRRFTEWGDWAGYKYGFNITCTGSNIKSISYQIEGEHTYFEIIDNEKASRERTQEEIDSGNASALTYTKNVSFDYNNQESITDDRIVSIYLGYPVPDDVKEIFAQERSGERTRHQFYEAGTGLDIAAAKTLARAKLILTATFTDGSTETKAYVISPVEGFEQQIADYWKAACQWNTEWDKTDKTQAPVSDRPEKPAIYTITEVDAS